MKIKNWEIWQAYVKYEDSDEIKERPVLVLDSENIFVLSFKITSHKARKNFKHEYIIKYWKECGLSKPSVIRLDHQLKLYEKDFIRKRGKLSDYDSKKVLEELIEKFNE